MYKYYIIMPIIDTTVIYNKNNTFGISNDIKVLDSALKQINAKHSRDGWTFGQLRHIDSKDFPVKSDVQFHIEMPAYAHVPWAQVNILMVNPDHYYPAAYDSYLAHFDAVICKDAATAAHFEAICGGGGPAVYTVPWLANCKPDAMKKLPHGSQSDGFVAFVGGSENKCAALEELIPHWNTTHNLTVYTARRDLYERLALVSSGIDGVTIKHIDLADDERERLQRFYIGHVVVSCGEGFGHAAAEGRAAGAFLILNTLPVYTDTYRDLSGVAWIASAAAEAAAADADATLLPKSHLLDISCALDAAFREFASWTPPSAPQLQSEYEGRKAAFVAAMVPLAGVVYSKVSKTPRHIPPILREADCPPISIITLTYNRRAFADLCSYNLLLTDYPRDKIEWVVVEDSDDLSKAASDKFMKFAADHPEFKFVFVPVGYKMPIGAKRNLGVEQATNEICLFMDDDDFYPRTSFRRRVAWLVGSPAAGAVTTTTLPMYDLMTAKSAITVPPWNIPLHERISEAALTFRKSFWAERKFDDGTNIAEGSAWLKGREASVVEICPHQIIVALSHGANISSRVIPEDAPVGCAWGWPRELMMFLHGLVGVRLEGTDDVAPGAK
jgi:hypothetical protein